MANKALEDLQYLSGVSIIEYDKIHREPKGDKFSCYNYEAVIDAVAKKGNKSAPITDEERAAARKSLVEKGVLTPLIGEEYVVNFSEKVKNGKEIDGYKDDRPETLFIKSLDEAKSEDLLKLYAKMANVFANESMPQIFNENEAVKISKNKSSEEITEDNAKIYSDYLKKSYAATLASALHYANTGEVNKNFQNEYTQVPGVNKAAMKEIKRIIDEARLEEAKQDKLQKRRKFWNKVRFFFGKKKINYTIVEKSELFNKDGSVKVSKLLELTQNVVEQKSMEPSKYFEKYNKWKAKDDKKKEKEAKKKSKPEKVSKKETEFEKLMYKKLERKLSYDPITTKPEEKANDAVKKMLIASQMFAIKEGLDVQKQEALREVIKNSFVDGKFDRETAEEKLYEAFPEQFEMKRKFLVGKKRLKPNDNLDNYLDQVEAIAEKVPGNESFEELMQNFDSPYREVATEVGMLEPEKVEEKPENQNTGNQNAGNENTGNENAGNDDTGNQNAGNENTGNENAGNDDTGNQNTGNESAGNENAGNENTGNENAGNENTGNENAGNENTGNENAGNENTGNQNAEEQVINDKLFRKYPELATAHAKMIDSGLNDEQKKAVNMAFASVNDGEKKSSAKLAVDIFENLHSNNVFEEGQKVKFLDALIKTEVRSNVSDNSLSEVKEQLNGGGSVVRKISKEEDKKSMTFNYPDGSSIEFSVPKNSKGGGKPDSRYIIKRDKDGNETKLDGRKAKALAEHLLQMNSNGGEGIQKYAEALPGLFDKAHEGQLQTAEKGKKSNKLNEAVQMMMQQMGR